MKSSKEPFKLRFMGVQTFQVIAVALLASVLFVQIQVPSLAATAKEQAIASYQSGKFADAAARFEQIIKANPADATAHYYLGMCYQKLNQPAKAKAEYDWVVANSKESALVTTAKRALLSSGFKTSAPVTTPVTTASMLPTVIDFSAAWCAPCKKFEPVFNKVANDYKGRVEFLRVDVEDPKQKALVDKYKVSVMPTIVFRDARGTARLISEGVMDETSLVQEVNSLLK